MIAVCACLCGFNTHWVASYINWSIKIYYNAINANYDDVSRTFRYESNIINTSSVAQFKRQWDLIGNIIECSVHFFFHLCLVVRWIKKQKYLHLIHSLLFRMHNMLYNHRIRLNWFLRFFFNIIFFLLHSIYISHAWFACGFAAFPFIEICTSNGFRLA